MAVRKRTMAYENDQELMLEEQNRVKRMKKDQMGLSLAVKAEVEEMWETVGAGAFNSIVDTGAFNSIVDTGVQPLAVKVDEENEIDALFNMGKKKKKKTNEKSPEEIAMEVEQIMAEMEVTAEEDAELNRKGEPAVNKLKKMSRLTEVLSKKQLQQVFLDHGILTLLKTWLAPLPDGSLPNIYIREGILKILMDFPLDLEVYERRDQLKRSGLGKAIMYFAKYDEETTCTRKLATELVDKWSRPLFNKSTRFEDMRNVQVEKRVPRPSVSSSPRMERRDGDDLDLDDEFSRKTKAPSSSSGQIIRPEVSTTPFYVRPPSNIDTNKKAGPDQRLIRMNNKLQQLKAHNKKQR